MSLTFSVATATETDNSMEAIDAGRALHMNNGSAGQVLRVLGYDPQVDMWDHEPVDPAEIIDRICAAMDSPEFGPVSSRLLALAQVANAAKAVGAQVAWV